MTLTRRGALSSAGLIGLATASAFAGGHLLVGDAAVASPTEPGPPSGPGGPSGPGAPPGFGDSVSPPLQVITAQLQSQESLTRTASLASVCDEFVTIPEIGQIAYRPPIRGNRGPSIVLLHGIYGGVSHREQKPVADALDRAGARVYLVDLPGVGRSVKTKRRYNVADLDTFLLGFLRMVVRGPVHLVASGVPSTSALVAARTMPTWVRTVTLVDPVGVRNAATPPSAQLTGLYEALLSTENVSTWINLITPDAILRFANVVVDPTRLDPNRFLEELLIQRANLDQRWISYAFITGQLYRPLSEVASVTQPVLCLFGKPVIFDFTQDGGPLETEPVVPDGPDDVRPIAPDFRFSTAVATSALPSRELPQVLAREILRHALR